MSKVNGIVPLCLSRSHGNWVFELEVLVSRGRFYEPVHRTVDDPQLVLLAVSSLSDRLRKAALQIMSDPDAKVPKDGYVPLDGKWVPAQWAELLGLRRRARRTQVRSRVAGLRQQVEALRKENRALRRDNDALAAAVAELNRRVARPASSAQAVRGPVPLMQADRTARQSYRAETQA